MLGSDHADNLITEITKIETVGLTENEKKSVFEETAINVFNLMLKI